MKAQASARVDVPTAPFSFAVRTMESTTCMQVCANAWPCACQATDRDLESKRREENECLDICACLVTDRDLESSSTMKKMNAWICAPPTTDRDPASAIPDEKTELVTAVIFTYIICFGINKSRNNYFCNFLLLTWIVSELLASFACNRFRPDGMTAHIWSKIILKNV